MFDVSIDLSELYALGLNVDEKFRKVAHEAQMQLADATFLRIKQMASEKLHSRREIFLKNFKLEDPKQPGQDSVITLLGEAVWIDEGLPPDYLFDALIHGPNSKMGENGRYNIVKFDHGPKNVPTNTTPYDMELVNAIKDSMKKQKIPWSKIKTGEDGKPIVGKIFSQTINSNKTKDPLKTHAPYGGVGQGVGPIGAPRQGHTGIPLLKGAAVYQRMDKEWDEVKGMEVEKPNRYVLTFRTASQAHPEKWHHPGLPPMNFMKSGWEWAMETLEKDILPKLVESYF